MKQAIAFILFLSAAPCFAQRAADSSYSRYQDAAWLEIAHRGTAGLIASPLAEYGTATLKYGQGSGPLRLAQQANLQRSLSFNTEGLQTLSRFKLWGYFSLQRLWQDSLAWTTRGLDADDQPYYFASSKSGKYERLKYDMGGTMAYTFRNQISLGLKATYFYNNMTRSVDPRPEVNTFRLVLMPGLAYRKGRHTIGVEGTWGYGDETIVLDYKNRDFAGSLGYKDRINYLVQGFGEISIMQGGQSMYRDLRYSGGAVTYRVDGMTNSFTGYASYLVSREDTKEAQASSANTFPVGLYTVSDIGVKGVFSLKQDGRRSDLSAEMLVKDGYDTNPVLGGSNYEYYMQHFSLTFDTYPSGPGRSLAVSASVSFYRLGKTDRVTGHRADYRHIEPSFRSTILNTLHGGDQLSFYLSPAISIPVLATVSVPATQVNVFTRGVIFPDHYFRASTILQTKAGAEYLTGKVLKQVRSGISAGIGYSARLSTAGVVLPADFFPGKARLAFTTALNFYF